MRHGDKSKKPRQKKSTQGCVAEQSCLPVDHSQKNRNYTGKSKSFTGLCRTIDYKRKENTTHQRRIVFSYLQDKEAIKELFGLLLKK